MSTTADITVLASWGNFYAIAGTAAAGLTGLQFVVVVLGSERSNMREQAVRAYATPTIVHFCAVLLTAAVMTAPWQTLLQVGAALGLFGVVGVIYTLMTLWHARKQKDYKPVFEDWLWHTILPFTADAVLLAASMMLPLYLLRALFAIGGSAILLLLVGIHNAWDAAIYMAIERSRHHSK